MAKDGYAKLSIYAEEDEEEGGLPRISGGEEGAGAPSDKDATGTAASAGPAAAACKGPRPALRRNRSTPPACAARGPLDALTPAAAAGGSANYGVD